MFFVGLLKWIGSIGNQSKFPLNNRNNMRKKTTSSCGIEFLQFLPTTVFNMKQKITTEIYVEDYKLTKVMSNNQKSQAFLSCNLTEIVTL